MDKEISVMLQSKLFEGFNASDCMILYSLLKPTMKSLIKGEVIVHEKEKLQYLGILCKGKLTSVKYDYEGNMHLMQIIEKGNFFGLEIMATKTCISPVTIISVEDSSVLKFSKNKLILQEILPPKFQIKLLSNMIRLIANEDMKKIYKIETLSSKSLRGRILTYLYLIKNKRGTSTFSIGMNREQFAQYLCVNRSALSHELSLMKKEGIISFNKDVFTFYD
ncbi:Crp/Fnr family transcriptional regulator [Anaerovorax odorimutans]|uniref:Crp/Fnr family transcriptional regulator n=1 Tax=Anaerovorax odorimutans TaxID=109327 RepID=UPI00040486C6|nr:Crp/Fnr family transcriptional regulator [Anaerovorax odorimutans]